MSDPTVDTEEAEPIAKLLYSTWPGDEGYTFKWDLLTVQRREKFIIAVRNAIGIPSEREITGQIITEIYKAVEKLGGMSDILSMIGSWRDTLPDADVLAGLKEWNASALSAASSIPTGWETIDSAPKDWSSLILFDPLHCNDAFQGFYSCADGGHDAWKSSDGILVEPTHWQPLPAPPGSEPTPVSAHREGEGDLDEDALGDAINAAMQGQGWPDAIRRGVRAYLSSLTAQEPVAWRFERRTAVWGGAWKQEISLEEPKPVRHGGPVRNVEPLFASPHPVSADPEEAECPRCVGTGSIESQNIGPPDFGFMDCPQCSTEIAPVSAERKEAEEKFDAAYLSWKEPPGSGHVNTISFIDAAERLAALRNGGQS